MKNATKYQKKVRKLLSSMSKSAPLPTTDRDCLDVLVEGIVQADASAKQAAKALTDLDEEFVDTNELRVAPPKDVADALGRDHPFARRKADEITAVLNAIYLRKNGLSLDHAERMTKRDLRRHLAELGLDRYAGAYLVLMVFGGHAIPVDETLAECLEMDGYVEPGSDLADVQGFLERVILQKDAYAAHLLFRDYIAKSARALARKRKADAARAAAEAKARDKAEAEAKARAEAEAKAQAQAKAAKARARAKAARAKARKTKAARAKTRRKPAKAKATGKTAKRKKTVQRARAKAKPAKAKAKAKRAKAKAKPVKAKPVKKAKTKKKAKKKAPKRSAKKAGK